MTRVLAFVDHSHLDTPIIETARTVARLTGAQPDVVHVMADADREDGGRSAQTVDAHVRNIPGPVVSSLSAEIDADDVAFAVMGARDLAASEHPLGHVTESLIVSSRVPIAIVPPSGRSLAGVDLKLLVPLDGEHMTSRTLTSGLPFADWGEVTALHVIGAGSAPMFFTSVEDRAVIADEFAARHAGDIATTVELRLGQAADEIVAAVHRLEIDAVVLCWHQRFSPDRAEVVRRLLRDGQVPLILLPI